MFEDALMESSGRLKTRSRQWSAAGVLLNGFLLAALVLAPLLYPEALPKAAVMTALIAPPPPPATPPPQPLHIQRQIESMSGIETPTRIPIVSRMTAEPGPPPEAGEQGMSANPGGLSDVIGRGFGTNSPVIVQAPPRKVAVSSGVMAGNILFKPEPAYPVIAREARVEGTVVLSATISKSGAIENLSIVQGPRMLAAAALDAVRQWRYKPFLLNGAPVEVQTQINVTFSLSS